MISNIITSVLILGGIGIVAGILIAISNKVLYVAPDKRIEQIFKLLPHFNCGACGTPGCQAMAAELVEGSINLNKCRPATPEQRKKITEKMIELEIISGK